MIVAVIVLSAKSTLKFTGPKSVALYSESASIWNIAEYAPGAYCLFVSNVLSERVLAVRVSLVLSGFVIVIMTASPDCACADTFPLNVTLPTLPTSFLFAIRQICYSYKG